MRNPRFQVEIREETRKIPEAAAARAAAIAVQIGHSIAYTGAYARSIGRTGTTVYSTDPGAMAIEFGTRNNPAFAPLRRAADNAGVT